jgi:trk system potassium uptake protein TrkH
MQTLQYLRPTLYATCFFSMHVAVAMLLPAFVDLADGSSDWMVFVGVSVAVFVFSLLGILSLRQPLPRFSPRFGFLVTTVLWVATCLISALPFYFSALELSFAQSVFEAVSGLTTTGSTVIAGLDNVPRGILLWRALLQFFGGIGIVAIGLFLFPFLRIGGMQLFRAESSDRSDKTLPRVVQLTTALVVIYVGLNVLCTLVYAALGMTFFDAVTHALTTVSTGGFSTHDASLGFFTSPAIHWAAIVFMILGGLPFVLFVDLCVNGRLTLLSDIQVRVFVGVIVIVSLVLTIWLTAKHDMRLPDALTLAAFNVTSIVTTTGFASADYAMWGPFAVALFLMLTFIGGCSGSTTGGIKVYRFIIVFAALNRALHRLVYPNAVVPLRYGDRRVDTDVFESVMTFLIAFFALLAIITVLLSLTSGLDLVTSLTGAITALCNVGPGLGDIIGPAGNFASLDDAAVWVLSAAMLLGRLEIMTILVLLSPIYWRS